MDKIYVDIKSNIQLFQSNYKFQSFYILQMKKIYRNRTYTFISRIQIQISSRIGYSISLKCVRTDDFSPFIKHKRNYKRKRTETYMIYLKLTYPQYLANKKECEQWHHCKVYQIFSCSINGNNVIGQ